MIMLLESLNGNFFWFIDEMGNILPETHAL